MNNQGQWNMNQYCFNNQRNRNQQRNKYQSSHYQNFPSNFNRQWNSQVMGFESNRYQPDFRHKRHTQNRQQFRMVNTNYNNNRRRRRPRFDDSMSSRNSWVLEDEGCFEETEPINFIPVHQERKKFHRESSLPPVIRNNRVHEPRPSEFYESRSGSKTSIKPFKPVRPETPVKENMENDFSPSTFKRTIRADDKSDQMHLAWSDSESDSKDASWVDSVVEHKSEEEEEEEPLKVVQKDEQNLISMIWSDENDEDCSRENNENSNTKGRRPFKYTTKSIPPYDGKNITGEEGVFEIKVFHCTFCNIICLDKEKSKAHMLTKYHYKHYKKELEKYEDDTDSENANEE